MDGEGGSVSFSCLLASTFDRSAIGRLRLVRAGHQSTTGEQTTLARLVVTKNFHLEICASSFEYVYGVLNVVKQ